MKYFFAGVIVPAGALVPIVVALIRYRQLTAAYWCLFTFLCFTLAANIASNLLAEYSVSNMPLLHADTIIELWLFSLFFIYSFRDKATRQFIRVMMILFPLFCLVNFRFFQSIYQFNTYTRPVQAIILIFLSLWYWWKEIQTEPETVEERWTDIAHNWAVSSILLYFASALALFVFSNYLMHLLSKPANIFIWNMHAALVLMMYLLLTVAFYKCKK